MALSSKNASGFSAVKQKKCRKSPGPVEFDGIASRDNVQSPAYSDISDDSTPVGEQDILGMRGVYNYCMLYIMFYVYFDLR